MGFISAVLAFGEAFRKKFLEGGEIFVELNALFEETYHLHAFRYLHRSLHAVVVETLDGCAFVGQTWQTCVNLSR